MTGTRMATGTFAYQGNILEFIYTVRRPYHQRGECCQQYPPWHAELRNRARFSFRMIYGAIWVPIALLFLPSLCPPPPDSGHDRPNERNVSLLYRSNLPDEKRYRRGRSSLECPSRENVVEGHVPGSWGLIR